MAAVLNSLKETPKVAVRMIPNLTISLEETGVDFLTGLLNFLVVVCNNFLTTNESVGLLSKGRLLLWKKLMAALANHEEDLTSDSSAKTTMNLGT